MYIQKIYNHMCMYVICPPFVHMIRQPPYPSTPVLSKGGTSGRSESDPLGRTFLGQ